IYNDSKIANKIQLGRTKMESIIKNILSPFSIECIMKKINEQNLPFSISTGASNKGNRKFFPLAFWYSGLHILDFYEQFDETSESIKNLLKQSLKSFNINIKNMIAYGAYNAPVNYGETCSVYQKLKSECQSSLTKANCNCHIVHNAVKHCLKTLSFDVEGLVLKVFIEFSTSAKTIMYSTLPYVKNFTEKFQNVYRKNNLNIAYKPINSLNKFIKTSKDKLDKMDNSNVVYKINCCNCDCSYVGQTKRKLKIRIKEHKADIRKSNNHSVVSLHQLQYGHQIDWENINILDSERLFYKRSISEMIHIKKQENGINNQNDTEKLPNIYLPIIQSLS
ncbi:hypothetical protein ALC57_17868, partial [Trachymyrmex cornetzi]